MAGLNTEPVSCSAHDISAWVAGTTRLTHAESDVVRHAVNETISRCGAGRKRPDVERDAYRQARCGLLPVIGLWGWLRIAGWVWRAVQLLLDYYDREPEAAGG